MTARQRNWPLILPFAALGTLLIIALTPALAQKPGMAEALSIDLILSVPLMWFLVIRKRSIPNITVVPVSVLCLILGFQILPEEGHYVLQGYESYVLPLLELAVVSFVVYEVVKLRRAMKLQKQQTSDFFDLISMATKEVLPGKLAPFLALEISMFYYAFRWSKGQKRMDSTFTYHRDSGVSALYGAVVFIILVETVALHFLLVQWSSTFAWVLTILSTYTGLQFLAFTRSMSARPLVLDEHSFHFRLGTFAQGHIPLALVERAYKHTADLPEDKSIKKLGLLGDLESHNIVLELKSAIPFTRLYGKVEHLDKVAFWVDEPDAFLKSINTSIQ